MSYKLKDRVVGTSDLGRGLKGKEGTVVEVGGSLGIAFDEEFIAGHTCCENCETGHGWYVDNCDIELIVKDKIGDGFVVGVTVERIIGMHGGMKCGDRGVITKVTSNSVKIEGYPNQSYNWHSKKSLQIVSDGLKTVKEQKGGEEGMLKEVIADNFEKTEDAIVVEKHLGHLIQDNFISGLVVAANKDAILKEAQHLKAAAQKAEDKE